MAHDDFILLLKLIGIAIVVFGLFQLYFSIVEKLKKQNTEKEVEKEESGEETQPAILPTRIKFTGMPDIPDYETRLTMPPP